MELRHNFIRESHLVEQGITRTRSTCKRLTQGQQSEWVGAKKIHEAGNCQNLSNSFQMPTWDSKKYKGWGGVQVYTRSQTIGNDTSRWTESQIDSLRMHHQESEEEHASRNRQAFTHTSNDWWKANSWTKSWWERSKGPERKSEGILSRW